MLRDLNKFDGPSKDNGGYERWNKWWNQFAEARVRLEDCTGQLLGTLPQDEDDDDSEEEEDDESEEDYEEEDEDETESGSEEDEDEYDSESESEGFRVPPLPEGNGRTMELTRLLQEVRAMNKDRDEEMIARVRVTRPHTPP